MFDDRHRLLGIGSTLVAAALLATLGPLARLTGDAGVGAFGFVAWRCGIGAAVLATAIAGSGMAGRTWAVLHGLDGGDRRALATVSGLAVVVNLAMFTAFELIPIGIALMLFYAYPALVAAIDVRLGREPWSASRAGAIGLASVGVVLLLAGSGTSGGGPIAPTGIALALLAAAAQAVFVTISRTSFPALAPSAAIMVMLAVSAVGAALASLAAGDPAQAAGPLLRPGAWPPIVIAGVLAAGLASFLMLHGIRRLGGTRSGMLMLLEPVVGTALAAFLFDETLGPVQVLGALLVLVGAVIVQRLPHAPVAAGRAAAVAVGVSPEV